MKKLSVKMFQTNADMANKDTLRYCESLYQYFYHLTNFFGMSLAMEEMRWLNYIIQRIEAFLVGAPTTDKYRVIVARYSRLLPKLKRIFNEQSSTIESAE